MRGSRADVGLAVPHWQRFRRYLLRRKEEWTKQEEEERRARERTEGCPAGMVVMPEEERLETLRALEKNILPPPPRPVAMSPRCAPFGVGGGSEDFEPDHGPLDSTSRPAFPTPTPERGQGRHDEAAPDVRDPGPDPTQGGAGGQDEGGGGRDAHFQPQPRPRSRGGCVRDGAPPYACRQMGNAWSSGRGSAVRSGKESRGV